ncbi:MAG: aminotransferase class I/II-fold pyridoxal phosphate-dependent enzyme [Putridiphycobacter sp.]
MKIPPKIEAKLQERIDQNALRQMVDFSDAQQWVDFFSNDYLGMARVEFDDHFAAGSTGSRLISGNLNYTEELEQKLAQHFNQPAGLFFNSGFDANLGIFSAIPQRGDNIIYDELVHASIRDGIRLSFANNFSFKHNDISHLEERLKQAKGSIYVAVESIYSMDGDEAPLHDLVRLCQQYGAYLIVDEAHSGGLYGALGEGLVSKYNLDDAVFLKLITFGKAYGSHGALVLGNPKIRQFLINFARSFIYTTALPLHSLKRIEQAIDLSKLMTNHRRNLFDLVSYFKTKAKVKAIDLIESQTPIQSILVPGNTTAKALEQQLQQNGFAVKAILSPTVPKGQERIRICLHAHNMKNHIDELFELL